MSILLASVGGEVLLVFLLPFWVCVLGYCGSYAAHCLFVVVEQTAGGYDHVVWPRARFTDWCGKAFHLLGIVLIWIVPPAFLLYPIDGAPSTALAASYALLCVTVLWLILPVSLLSAMSAESSWVVLRWAVVQRLARCWRPLLLFYILTGMLQFGWFGLLGLAAIGWDDLMTAAAKTMGPPLDGFILGCAWLLPAPLVGLSGATVLLLYARLLGRLAWLVQLPQLDAKPPAEDEVVPAPAAEEATPPSSELASTEMAASTVATGEIYTLANEPLPVPPPAPPFRWQPGRIPPPAPPRRAWRDQPGWSPPTENDREAEDPAEEAELVGYGSPIALLSPKVFLFPWYWTSLWPWTCLTFGGVCITVLVRMHMAY